MGDYDEIKSYFVLIHELIILARKIISVLYVLNHFIGTDCNLHLELKKKKIENVIVNDRKEV